MFEDLTEPQPSREDLKDTIKKFREALKESRDHIIDQQNIFDDLKNDFDEVKQDAGRFAKHIDDMHRRIIEKDLIDDFSDLEIPE